MLEKQEKWVRFEKLHVCNYGALGGSYEFIFDRLQTLIVGACGTGKSTIVNALAELGAVDGVMRSSISHQKRCLLR